MRWVAARSVCKFKVRPWWDVFARVEAVSKVTPPYFRLVVLVPAALLSVQSAGAVAAERRNALSTGRHGMIL